MIPAASLILIREAPAGPEFLMVERSAAMAFAPGALVFPGGRIDPADEALALAVGRAEEAAKVAAIRECIEESGVAVGLTPCPDPHSAAAMQGELLDGRDFSAILEGRQMRLTLGALTPFARWFPGPEVSRRFDTCFFIAKAPDGEWTPSAASGECVSARWVTAHQALAEEQRGEARLIFPTRKNLERLALHSTLAAILDDATRHPVVTITPVVETVGAARFVTIPEGLGYPNTRDPIERVRRS